MNRINEIMICLFNYIVYGNRKKEKKRKDKIKDIISPSDFVFIFIF